MASSIFVNDDDERLFQSATEMGRILEIPKLRIFAARQILIFHRAFTGELKANLDNLVTAYPSGMDINALLVAKNLGVGQKKCKCCKWSGRNYKHSHDEG